MRGWLLPLTALLLACGRAPLPDQRPPDLRIRYSHDAGMIPLTYRATVHDPVIWTADWTVELPWVRDDSYQFFEYACAEDNVMIRNYITSSRAERGLWPVEA